jgi:hypothetical protein
MGVASSTHREVRNVCSENMKGRGHLADLGRDWRIVLKPVLKKEGVMDSVKC